MDLVVLVSNGSSPLSAFFLTHLVTLFQLNPLSFVKTVGLWIEKMKMEIVAGRGDRRGASENEPSSGRRCYRTDFYS